MRIKELSLKDWSVIRQADLEELSDFVVIAGPNGVGKTKIKDSIVHIFQNNGNPPPKSTVVLEATNLEEEMAWSAKEIALPQNNFWSHLTGKNNKRLKTKSRLIQIDSNRIVESVNFQQLTFQSIGNPAEEEVGYNYGYNNIKDRFKDICHTLHRLKSKEVTSLYEAYQSQIDVASEQVTLNKLVDPTASYIDLFGKLLHPKQMLTIDINSLTIQYKDEDGETRDFSALSSGEREAVILTFDILAQNPSDCIILIDEPEVHLHPELTFRLIKVLKSIGERNQYFLFTHSADIIGNSLVTGVHFIRPKSKVTEGSNQVIRVDENNTEAFQSIPNIRETIGMVSVGKKLLFVEGNNTSIDRNVFATLARASSIDVAIIPSESCSNINNMSLMCETLEKGLFGVELFMVRDRDGLVDEQVNTFSTKSNSRLSFLPFYHIENAFLNPQAIAVVAKKIRLANAPTAEAIEQKMIELAKQQLMHTAALYVKSEVYFKAGNFDISPKISINHLSTIQDIKIAMTTRKAQIMLDYNTDFSEIAIETRLNYWHALLNESIKSGWSKEARKYFFGKRLLKELQNWLFGSKNILIWEHIINSEEAVCIESCKELRDILSKI